MPEDRRSSRRSLIQGGRSNTSVSPVIPLTCLRNIFVDTSSRDRPDAIRCIVASLVGDGESGDSLVDDNEPIQPLQRPEIENYADPEWTPEPIDAGPGRSVLSLTVFSRVNFNERFPR
jgi:hypothetical protein